jgi:hypothetical protein
MQRLRDARLDSLARFYFARAAASPTQELYRRFRDLSFLLSKAAAADERLRATLLRMRVLCGRPGFVAFLRRLP